MSPSPTAVAILVYGKPLQDQQHHRQPDRDAARIQQVEEQLIAQLLRERSPTVKKVFDFNIGRPIEPLVVRDSLQTP